VSLRLFWRSVVTRRLGAGWTVLAGSALLAGCAHSYTRWEPDKEKVTEILRLVLESDHAAAGGAPVPARGSRDAQERLQMTEKGYRPYKTLFDLAQDTLPEEFQAMQQAAQRAPAEPTAEELEKVAAFLRKLTAKSGRLVVYDFLKPKGVPPSWVAAAQRAAGVGAPAGPTTGEPTALAPGTGPIRSPDHCRSLVHKAAKANTRQLELLYGDEFREIDAAKEEPHAKRIGLALSGGGVRSASFSVGILQGLYELGLLEEVGYLSCVSGGAYAAAWYMLHAENDDALLRRGSTHLRHLSQNGYFLVSAHSSDYTSELAGKLVLHTLALPGHWALNGLLDLEVNWPFLRVYYEAGLARTYQYRNPLSLEEKEQRQFRSMRDCSPLRYAARGLPRPFWIVNTHVAFNDDRGGARSRNGDAFEITPLRAGSDTTGYLLVPEGELPGNHSWLTPRRAVAMSGAAVDSQGVPQSFLLGLLSQAVNLDLGRYVQSWDDDWISGSSQGWLVVGLRNTGYYLSSPFPVCMLLSPLLSLMDRDWHLGHPWHERTQHGKYYRLTDGGHFDNLGIYALVRRGCRLIIVSDATAEAEINDWSEPHERRAVVAQSGSLIRLEIRLREPAGSKEALDPASVAYEPVPEPVPVLVLDPASAPIQ
jgi:hypothetical protein